jgi:hypothetical protein
MPKVTEENAYDDLKFVCPRCNKEAIKESKYEPDLGYVSKVNGKFEKLCQLCFDELPERDRAFIPLMEAMIIVGIRANGEGLILTEDGIETDYRRSPTPFELKAACHQIISDLEGMEQSQRQIGMLAQSGLLNQVASSGDKVIQLPRKR